MFARKLSSTTDPRLRSLLQKAVRRGYSRVAEQTVRALDRNGDSAWLRARSVVITFEECWPLARQLDVTKTVDSKIRALVSAAVSVKYKDAAGLGALAYAHSEGDATVLIASSDTSPIRLVTEALKRPSSFFEWCEKSFTSQDQSDIVKAARRYLGSAGWAWDKACILAAAYLAVKTRVPTTSVARAPDHEFPYWVALDKHTPQGKDTLRQVAKKMKKPYRQILWASFYFESALVNELGMSPWWEVEKLWRLRKAGLSIDEAETIWDQAREHMRHLLRQDGEMLKTTVEFGTGAQDGLTPQHELQL